MKKLQEAWRQSTPNKLAISGFLLLVTFCGCCILVSGAFYLSTALRPTATPSASSPFPISTPVPATLTRPPTLTPLPIQAAHFPTQTAEAMLQTVQADYSPTPAPASSTPTVFRPTYTPNLTPTRVKVTFAAHTPGSICNPAYPTICLTGRVSCQQIGIHNFPVLPPDPFGYDKDEDGRGCE